MKKVLKILTLVMLIITIIKIGDTYAKYFATANTATLSQDIAKWIIKIKKGIIKINKLFFIQDIVDGPNWNVKLFGNLFRL